MLSYKRLKKQARRFLAFTGLTHREFKTLLPLFEQAYTQLYPPTRTLLGQVRQRVAGGGRKSVLEESADKLFFILVYQKTYPLQIVQAELFGLSQASANYWIHHLLPVLAQALQDLGVKPERDGRQLPRAERWHKESAELIIDGTERRRQRPKNPEKQRLHYSGKKKAHSDKNLVIAHTHSRRVAYLSPTYVGKTHDKKMADQEQIAYPPATTLHQDTGFQGYHPKGARVCQPKKSRAGKN